MKNLRKISLITCMIILSMVFVFSKKTYASNLVQMTQTKTTIKIKWNPLNSEVGEVVKYYVYLGTDHNSACISEKRVALEPGTTSYTFKKLKAGTRYYARITCDYKVVETIEPEEDTTEKEDTSPEEGTTAEEATTEEEQKTIEKMFYNQQLAYGFIRTNAGVVRNLKVKRWSALTNEISFSWDKQTGAGGYEYTVIDTAGKVVKKGLTRDNVAYCKVASNKIYKAVVRSYGTIAGKKYWGDSTSTLLIPQTTCISGTKVKKGKLIMKWKPISGVSYYEIYVSKQETKGYKLVKKVSGKTHKLTIKTFDNTKIAKTDKFYINIMAYKTVGSKNYKSAKRYCYRIKAKDGYVKDSF